MIHFSALLRPAPRSMRFPCWVAMFLLLAGCGSDASQARPDAAANAYRAVPDLSIGELEGAEAYLFGSISGLALDDEGRIFVADAQANEVRAFSPEGEHLFSVGGTGSGPGELRNPCCAAFGPDGSLWVRDGGNARYNRYVLEDAGARYTGSVRMAHGDVNFAAPLTFDAGGRLIDIGHAPDPETGERRIARFHLDPAGAVVRRQEIQETPPDSLGVHLVEQRSGISRSVFYLWPPHGPRQLVAHSPTGDWAEALSSRYEVRWHGPDGALLRSVSRNVGGGPALSAEERSRAEEQIEEDAKRTGVSRREIPYGVPDRKPPLRGLSFDQAGRLWVELSVPDGAPRRAEVFDRSGELAAVVEWPEEVGLRAVDPAQGAAVGVASDSLGVQRVVRLRLQ